MLRYTLAAVHLIALGLGLGAVLMRGSALRDPPGTQSLRQAFRADTFWGVAAVLWIVTGVWRWLGSVEKSAGYYMTNHVFFAKMGFFLLILGLEIWPMIMLIRWRRAFARAGSADGIADPAAARRIATISHIEAALVMAMVFAAVAMARGAGARS